MFLDCKRCQTHQQELREQRMAHESEKDKMRKDHNEQIAKKDDLIKDLHDRLMSRDLYEKETAKNPPKEEAPKPEDDPYVDLMDVPLVAPKKDIEETLGK